VQGGFYDRGLLVHHQCMAGMVDVWCSMCNELIAAICITTAGTPAAQHSMPVWQMWYTFSQPSTVTLLTTWCPPASPLACSALAPAPTSHSGQCPATSLRRWSSLLALKQVLANKIPVQSPSFCAPAMSGGLELALVMQPSPCWLQHALTTCACVLC
jgi:hypothetical protein